MKKPKPYGLRDSSPMTLRSRWELSLLLGFQRQKVTIASPCADASAAVASYGDPFIPGQPWPGCRAGASPGRH